MEPPERLSTFDQLKIVSDPHRLSILRQLMTGSATLSQLGRIGIPAQTILGYNDEAHTHTEVANTIQQGRVQVGLGIHATAVSFATPWKTSPGTTPPI